ncbi:hypothetical protein MKX01_039614 [Papaver californicum]|nr:hypothetical protein MKX01_039614 [Papaver californicum]
MRFHLHHGRHHHHFKTLIRQFATKYSGRVTQETSNGKTFSVTIEAPIIQRDIRGYPIPRHDLICKITKILQSSSPAISPSSKLITDPFLQVSDYLRTLNITLTPSEASEILKSLKTPQKALEFFKFCSNEIPGFKHDCFTYNRILTFLSKSNSAEIVKRVVDEMESCGIKGNISTVNILIGIFDGVLELEKCVGLVKKWGLLFNCYTYKCLLQAYLRCNEVSKAFHVYIEMRRKGYVLDIFAYNMLLNALAKDDKAEQASKVFADMKRKHCEPDGYTYTIMIRMNGKIGKAGECLSLFQDMITKGCSPNLIAYNTMIQALARNHMGCQPNEFTYSVILDGLAAEGQLGKLDEVVEMSKKYMHKAIYSYLVKTLSKFGHASEAHRLFCNMWNFNDGGDRDAYMSMLESLCLSGQTAETLDLLNKIHEKGIMTETVMYNMVFSALGKLKQISQIHVLYEHMKTNGPSPDIFTYNILLASYDRAGGVDDAVKLFEEMENGNCRPDIITYNSLINCLGKNGYLDEAHMRFKEMQEKGLNPDVVTYSTLIECFGKKNRVEMALTLFHEMLAESCYPNIVTYNILLDCLEKCGKRSEALELYAKLKQQGLTPDTITYTVLDRLQSKSHKTVRIRRQSPIIGWVVSPIA